MPLIENVRNPLANSVLLPLRLTAAGSATDAAIHKKMFESGITTLIILDEKMNDLMIIIKLLKESDLLKVHQCRFENLPICMCS